MRTTLVIPSFQRREPLLRLLRGIATEVERDPGLATELDVVVVLDGSTDGSKEALGTLDLGALRFRWTWQPNAGLSAARNTGMAMVEHDEVVWFLDDDMVPGPRLARRHVDGHVPGVPIVLMGPCLFPEDRRVVAMNREWADHVFRELSASGEVRSADLFSAANTSAPRSTWERVGGFHEGFIGWGAEDHEIGLRLLAEQTPVRYDPEAVAWHEQERGIVGMCRTKEGEGANTVRLVRLHPEQVDELLPWSPRSRPVRALRRLRRSPRALAAVARALACAAAIEDRALGGRRRRVFDLAVTASLVAGAASVDGDGPLLSRLLDEPPAELHATR